jgi:simple sugar transport system permease protein
MSDNQEPTGSDVESPSEPESSDERSFRGKFWEQLSGIGADWQSLILVPILAVISALVIGAFIIAVSTVDLLELWGESPGEAFTETFRTIGEAYAGLFEGAFGSVGAISETLTAATPLILAGLAVAIGFRAGLFNIGAEGQMLIGGMSALMVGFSFEGLPLAIHLPLAIIAGIIGGAIWGGFPGWLRAKTGAHEVITTIMLNWIAIRLVDWALKTPFIQAEGRTDPISKGVLESARLPKLLGAQYRLHAGIILALLVAWFAYWLLFKSTIGYEFRAVGYNPDGARYAGISVTRAYVMVMAVAGAMAGVAGASQVLGVLHRGSPGFSGNIGFDAIALALLGRSHPFGVVLAGLLFGALRAGGLKMQAASSVGIDLVTIVQALIIVFIAAPALIRAVFRVKAGKGAEQLTKGWSA